MDDAARIKQSVVIAAARRSDNPAVIYLGENQRDRNTSMSRRTQCFQNGCIRNKIRRGQCQLALSTGDQVGKELWRSSMALSWPNAHNLRRKTCFGRSRG